LPEDEILLIGDLITVGTHPLARDGDVEEWIDILETIDDMPIERIMAGHGPTVGKEHIQVIHRYLSGLMNVAKRAITEDILLQELEKMPVPEEFTSWRLPHLYTNNLKALYASLQK
jgi:hypothetical protein